MADGNPPAPKTTWSSFLSQIYLTDRRPVNGSYDYRAVEEKAREVTKDYHAAFLYTYGTAGSGNTNRSNLEALQQWRIIPRVQGILHKDGELATASAASSVGVPYILSTSSSRSIEAVAKANGDGHRWYNYTGRAKAAGFTTLVVTLDTTVVGWWPADLNTAYLLFAAGVGIQVGTSDPVFTKRIGAPVRPDERPAFPLDQEAFRVRLAGGDKQTVATFKLVTGWLDEIDSGLFHTWEDLKFLRANWDGPIVLKGIQTVDDAHAAMDARMDGIVVSNHGGRQVDGAISSFSSLEKITASSRVLRAQKKGTFTVLFDSGIRQGSDVIKAIAMGAQGVFIGRPFMYGLAIAGEQGVEEVLRSILAETEITLGLSGYKSIEEIWAKRGAILEKADT
ncbi:FMN-dependent alpha-hydroxy acid dehydrogenase [Lactarius akahatsu]|uniref:FMN-dependent alpha-hydroxy acid dehydrogenase n=1 Tax=Lactarius akahatsu TaxID=416441 RepID=A0AAD4L7U7_9AGAM|nr:FMN-dependent alpha-hydroxy acid dehydrogenase [Lactarius akahatsu]